MKIKSTNAKNWNSLRSVLFMYMLVSCCALLFINTYMEGCHEEGQSEEVQVGVHKDSFNLISILFCETCSTEIDGEIHTGLGCRPRGLYVSMCVCEGERLTHQTVAGSKQRLACGSRTGVSPGKWNHRRWSEGAPWWCRWSPSNPNIHTSHNPLQNNWCSLLRHAEIYIRNDGLCIILRQGENHHGWGHVGEYIKDLDTSGYSMVDIFHLSRSIWKRKESCRHSQRIVQCFIYTWMSYHKVLDPVAELINKQQR